MTRITDELFDRGIQLAADTNAPSIGLVSEPLKRRDVYLEMVPHASSDGPTLVRKDVAIRPAHGWHIEALVSNMATTS